MPGAFGTRIIQAPAPVMPAFDFQDEFDGAIAPLDGRQATDGKHNWTASTVNNHETSGDGFIKRISSVDDAVAVNNLYLTDSNIDIQNKEVAFKHYSFYATNGGRNTSYRTIIMLTEAADQANLGIGIQIRSETISSDGLKCIIRERTVSSGTWDLVYEYVTGVTNAQQVTVTATLDGRNLTVTWEGPQMQTVETTQTLALLHNDLKRVSLNIYTRDDKSYSNNLFNYLRIQAPQS